MLKSVDLSSKKVICVLAVNAVLLAAMTVLDVLFIIKGGLYLKGLASACFTAAGIANLVYAALEKRSVKFASVMLAGLTLSLIADIVLNIHFIIGAAIFALAHVAYIAAYCVLSRYKWQDLVSALIIFVPSVLFITLAPIFDFGGAIMEVVCVIYALVLSLMVGKAIFGAIKNFGVVTAIIAAGSVLFFVSDLSLLITRFAHVKVMTIICLATYYPAQFLLAFSVFAHAFIKKPAPQAEQIED